MPETGTPYAVLLTAGAKQDLQELHGYLLRYHSTQQASEWLDQLTERLASLAHFPERGSHPEELLALGIKEYRQIFCGPNRLIYRVIDRQVIIYLIMDGRRDMQALLARRLLQR